MEAICKDLSINYKDSMMTWKSGPHACDGPWAKWWYMNVHKSEGWQRSSTTKDEKYYPETRQYRTLDPSLMHSLKASFPAYEFLKKLTRGYKKRGPPANEIYEDPRNEHLVSPECHTMFDVLTSPLLQFFCILLLIYLVGMGRVSRSWSFVPSRYGWP